MNEIDPRLRAYWHTLNPHRRAFVAQCSGCHEGARSPLQPLSEDAGYEPYPKAPQALIDWCVAHDTEHGNDVLEYPEDRHRSIIWHVIWMENYEPFSYAWMRETWVPVVWQVDEALKAYEREHPPQTRTFAQWLAEQPQEEPQP